MTTQADVNHFLLTALPYVWTAVSLLSIGYGYVKHRRCPDCTDNGVAYGVVGGLMLVIGLIFVAGIWYFGLPVGSDAR